MMKERFIGNLDSQEVRDKHVLVRVDFNVPITTEDNTNTRIPADISRLKASLPTIQFLCQSGAKVILCSHLGRPRGIDMNLSLKILLRPLQDLVGLFSANVGFVHNCVGDEVEEAKMHLGSGDILLLENLRFHAEEVANDDEFSKQLASSIDLFVNDAFGSSHRAHASTVGVTRHISACYAGFLMKKELDFLGNALTNPVRPLVAMIGGSKISTKLGVLKSLLHKVDMLIVGGAMVYTFYRAKGCSVGDSLVEEGFVAQAHEIMELAHELGVELVLASDSHIVPTEYLKQSPNGHPDPHTRPLLDYSTHTPEKKGLEDAPVVAVTPSAYGRLFIPLAAETKRVVDNECIPESWTGVDIGPSSTTAFCNALELSRTVVWNGPMGMCEREEFAHGTVTMLNFMSHLTEQGCTTILCGGDTVAAFEHLQYALAHPVVAVGMTPQSLVFSHVSTGGGAALEFLEGKPLPGVEVLNDAH